MTAFGGHVPGLRMERLGRLKGARKASQANVIGMEVRDENLHHFNPPSVPSRQLSQTALASLVEMPVNT